MGKEVGVCVFFFLHFYSETLSLPPFNSAHCQVCHVTVTNLLPLNSKFTLQYLLCSKGIHSKSVSPVNGGFMLHFVSRRR